MEIGSNFGRVDRGEHNQKRVLQAVDPEIQNGPLISLLRAVIIAKWIVSRCNKRTFSPLLGHAAHTDLGALTDPPCEEIIAGRHGTHTPTTGWFNAHSETQFINRDRVL
jgi:hypothetical protein